MNVMYYVMGGGDLVHSYVGSPSRLLRLLTFEVYTLVLRSGNVLANSASLQECSTAAGKDSGVY